MKHLLSGTVLAAVLAFAIPAWAQTPAAPDTSNAPAASASAPTKAKAHTMRKTAHARVSHRSQMKRAAMHRTQGRANTMRKAAHARVSHRSQMKHAAMHRTQGRHYAARMHHPMHRMSGARMGPGDNVANQLNRQELQRMSGSSMPPAGYPNQQPGNAPPPPGYQSR
jgi:hypothetical protein